MLPTFNIYIMKKLTLILLVFCAFTTKAQNIILNGSFEINTSTLCFENLYTTTDYNNTVNFSSSYGYAIALFKDSCLKCNPPTYWGGGGSRRTLVYCINLQSILQPTWYNMGKL